MSDKPVFYGKLNAYSAEKFKNGEKEILTAFGNSMTPLIKSGQSVLIEPVSEETKLEKRDIVFCKVNGHYYLHLISAVKGANSFQISNNHGHVNGVIHRAQIFGKLSRKVCEGES